MYHKYSADLKAAAVHMHALLRMSLRKIQHALGRPISKSSLHRWLRLYKRTKSVVRDPQTYKPRARPRWFPPASQTIVNQMINSDASLFLDEIGEGYYKATGEWPRLNVICLELKNKLGLTLKKANVVHAKQYQYKRAAFVARIGRYPPHFLCFGDGSAVCNKSLQRPAYARSPRNQRVSRSMSSLRGKRYSLLPIVSITGVLAIVAKEGSILRADFEDFLENRVVGSLYLIYIL